MEPLKPMDDNINSIVNNPVNDKYEPLSANPMEILNNQSGITSLDALTYILPFSAGMMLGSAFLGIGSAIDDPVAYIASYASFGFGLVMPPALYFAKKLTNRTG